jgi:hypothetical protein
MADVFNFKDQAVKKPFTADRATLQWAEQGQVDWAINVQISYQQQINRRRVIGGNWAIRWGSQPQGQLTAQRILVSGANDEQYTGKIWDQCQDTEPLVVVLQDCNGTTGPVYTCTGPTIAQLQVTVEAESLTCLDNVVVEFLQLKVG